MSQTFRTLGALTLTLVAAACGGGDDDRNAIDLSYDRTEVDLAERLGLPDDGVLVASSAYATEVGVPAGASILIEASGEAGAMLHLRMGDVERELPFDLVDVHEQDLPGAGRQSIELELSVPAGSPAVDVGRVYLRVPDRAPDIVLIIIDTLRADVFITLRDLVDTPRIDEMLRDGVPFKKAFSHAPMTLPSHTALFSSRYPFESGVLNNGQTVPQDVPLFAEHLRDLGYQTRGVVSLGTLWPDHDDKGTRLDRGFDVYVPTPGHVTPAPVVREAISDALADLDPDRPLFFFAHFSDPHEPYNVHGERADGTAPFEADVYLDGEKQERVTTSDATYWVREVELGPGTHRFEVKSDRKVNVRLCSVKLNGKKLPLNLSDGRTGETFDSLRGKAIYEAVCEFENTADKPQTFEIEAWITDHPRGKHVPYRYFREVDYVDGHIGALLDELRSQGLYDPSTIVFTSDHGEALREHNFTGHVQNLYDEMTHVPLLIKPPLGHPATAALARNEDAVVRHVDVVPTLLEIAQLPALRGQRGLSLTREGPRPVISETHQPEATESQIAIRDESHKLIYFIDRDSFELYDLREDPKELKDVFGAQGDDFEEWQSDLKMMAELSKESGVSLEDMSDADRERMEAIGYFGDD